MLVRSNPDAARALLQMAQEDVDRQWHVYQNRASMPGQKILADVIEEPEPVANATTKGRDDE